MATPTTYISLTKAEKLKEEENEKIESKKRKVYFNYNMYDFALFFQ